MSCIIITNTCGNSLLDFASMFKRAIAPEECRDQGELIPMSQF